MARYAVPLFVFGLAACGARTSLRAGGEGGAPDATTTATTVGEGGCAPTSLEADSPGVEYLVADGERVFYSTRDHRVMAGDLDTGETQLLATPGSMALANAVTAYGPDVYFADNNSVWSVPKDGGDVVAVTEPIPQLFNLTADATGLYWTQAGGPSAARDVVRRLPDGSRVTIAKTQYGVYGLSPTPSGLVFTTQSADSSVLLGALDGSGIAALAGGLPPARFPFALGEHVYWVEENDASMAGVGAIARVKLDGTGYERGLVEEDPLEQTTRAITDGARFFIVRVGAPNRIVAGPFDGSRPAVTIAESDLLISSYSLVLTPKRLVYTTVDPGTTPSVRSLCLRDLALP